MGNFVNDLLSFMPKLACRSWICLQILFSSFVFFLLARIWAGRAQDLGGSLRLDSHTLTQLGNINCTWVRRMVLCNRNLSIGHIQVCSDGTFTGIGPFLLHPQSIRVFFLGFLCVIVNLDTTLFGYGVHDALVGKPGQLFILMFLIYTTMSLFSTHQMRIGVRLIHFLLR